MKPLKFKQATIELKKPASMTDKECSSLWIYQQDNQCISLWTTSLWERLKFLFHGKIWIGILSGKTQPPVWLDCKKTIFEEPEKSIFTIFKYRFLIFFDKRRCSDCKDCKK